MPLEGKNDFSAPASRLAQRVCPLDTGQAELVRDLDAHRAGQHQLADPLTMLP
jgi:hypothetical protein